jgi:hypothetical protein
MHYITEYTLPNYVNEVNTGRVTDIECPLCQGVSECVVIYL